MGRIVVTEFVSLDGVMQAPGGEDFKYPGWTSSSTGARTATSSSSTRRSKPRRYLIGRVTYESFAGAWPSREGEFADKFNTMPKYLVSSTITDPDWNNTTVLEGDVVEAVTKLRQEVDGDIQVPGSRRLVQELIENDLVDELHLMVFPVVLGTGDRMFGETTDKKTMRLKESRTVGEGILVLIYERAEARTARKACWGPAGSSRARAGPPAW